MNFRNVNWKDVAKVIGLILLASIIGNALKYYEYRHSALSELIPEWVMIQAAKPYLVATIASTLATFTAWIFYYFSKYKATVIVGLLTFIFEYVNFNIVGESWDF